MIVNLYEKKKAIKTIGRWFDVSND